MLIVSQFNFLCTVIANRVSCEVPTDSAYATSGALRLARRCIDLFINIEGELILATTIKCYLM